MSAVRVHPERARDLVERYATAGQDIRECVAELSPLVSQALALLDQPGQHPLYGPLPALTTAANDLAADGRDVDWRLDMILAGDARPMGMSGILRLDNSGPVVDDPNVDLVDALIAAGLTPVQAQNARRAIVDGASFGDAVEQERQRAWADNMAAFRRLEAEAWTERSPVDQARYSLDQIRVILDTARQDRDGGEGIGYGGDRDGVWSTNDLRAVIDNDHGFYTETQIEHARTVLAMAESSPEAREVLGITESGGGWSFADIGHLTLDVVGMVPVVGNAADAANAAWYAAEGDYLNAALSSLGMIPAIGQAVIAAKPVIIAASAGIVFKSLDEALAWAKRWLDDAGILARGSDEAVDGSVRGADSAANRASHEEYVSELRELEAVGSRGPDGAVAAADDARSSGATNGAAAQFDVDGNSFVDVSGSNTPLHPDVANALDGVPASQRSPWHGGCAEPRCVSQAIEAGVDPSGGIMNAVQIGDNGIVPHGNLRPPCTSCIALRNTIGYSQ